MKEIRIRSTEPVTDEEKQIAMLIRCCAKAIHRLERAGLQEDAASIRDELKSFNIDITIMPDQEHGEFGIWGIGSK